MLLPDPLGTDEQDWQPWLAGQLRETGREVRVVSWPEPAAADLDSCLAVLRRGLAGLPDDGFDVLAHSTACLLWLHHASREDAGRNTDAGSDTDAGSSPRPARVALVAPPAPDRQLPAWDFLRPVPLAVDALRRAADGTVLVGGDDDPQCPGGVAHVYGAPLKMAATVIAGGGALTAAAGFGPWPAVLDWCGRDNLAFRA
ncbi:MAG: serine hydrolase [Pseudonocardiales bacterium]|nr:serine hydrolase [Pseudonocardiales bacterium]